MGKTERTCVAEQEIAVQIDGNAWRKICVGVSRCLEKL